MGQGQAAAGAIRRDHHNKAAFCFPLQFSHMDNRDEKMGCVCSSEDARSIINVGQKNSDTHSLSGSD